MARIPPDVNDILVWKLDEITGVYRNTGSQLPNNSTTDLSISGIIDRSGSGVFATACPSFPGTHNYPAGASATRNYIFGANTINPQPPFSISGWVYLRNYQTANNCHLIGKAFRDHTITSSWASPFFAVELSNLTTNSGGDTYYGVASGIATQVGRTITDFPIPLQQWAHVGITHDGSAIRSYLNGCQLITYSGATQQLSTASNTVSYQDVSYAITSTSGATYTPGVTDIGNNGDEVRTSVNFPFPIYIYGTAFNSGFAGSNGQIEFGQNTSGFNFTLPNGSFGNLLCIFQKDQNTAPSPTFGIFTNTIGTVGSREFIIEWRNQPFGGGSTLNYQVKFFENSTNFECIYNTSTSGITGCIGIQSAAGGKSTVFSNSTTIPAAGTKLTFTPTLSSPGPWILGAIAATGSSSKEEANYMISDVRIANVIRPLSYFQNIYKVGVLPIALSTLTQYYKLRAYDTSCVTPTSVVWVDTQVSLTNAPSFPCSGPYSAPEVIDTWLA